MVSPEFYVKDRSRCCPSASLLAEQLSFTNQLVSLNQTLLGHGTWKEYQLILDSCARVKSWLVRLSEYWPMKSSGWACFRYLTGFFEGAWNIDYARAGTLAVGNFSKANIGRLAPREPLLLTVKCFIWRDGTVEWADMSELCVLETSSFAMKECFHWRYSLTLRELCSALERAYLRLLSSC